MTTNLLQYATTTTTGTGAHIQGTGVVNAYLAGPWGASATVTVDTSPDNATWTTVHTFTLAWDNQHKLDRYSLAVPANYVRCTISAIAGSASVSATVDPITATASEDFTGYTVATLPYGVEGARTFVKDATTPTFLGALTGGGAVVCPVFYNGTAWVSA